MTGLTRPPPTPTLPLLQYLQGMLPFVANLWNGLAKARNAATEADAEAEDQHMADAEQKWDAVPPATSAGVLNMAVHPMETVAQPVAVALPKPASALLEGMPVSA